MAIAETRQPLATGRKHCQSQLQPAKLAKSVQWGVALHQKILLCQTSPYGILLYETPRFAKKGIPKAKGLPMGASLCFAPILVGGFAPNHGGASPPKPPLPPPPHWDGRPVWILQAQEPAPSLGWLLLYETPRFAKKGIPKAKGLPQAWDASWY